MIISISAEIEQLQNNNIYKREICKNKILYTASYVYAAVRVFREPTAICQRALQALFRE